MSGFKLLAERRSTAAHNQKASAARPTCAEGAMMQGDELACRQLFWHLLPTRDRDRDDTAELAVEVRELVASSPILPGVRGGEGMTGSLGSLGLGDGVITSEMSREMARLSSFGSQVPMASRSASSIPVSPLTSLMAAIRSPGRSAKEACFSSSPRFALRSSCVFQRATGVCLRGFLSTSDTTNLAGTLPIRKSNPTRSNGLSARSASGQGCGNFTLNAALLPQRSPRPCKSLACDGQLEARDLRDMART